MIERALKTVFRYIMFLFRLFTTWRVILYFLVKVSILSLFYFTGIMSKETLMGIYLYSLMLDMFEATKQYFLK